MRLSRESSFLKRIFASYYGENSVPPPRDVGRREFGFILFDREGMIRHLSFKDASELNEFVRRNVPLHAYYSSAYYESPDAENMEDKGWCAADLVFDIDADHIPTPCKREHDKWTCLDCGFSSRGMVPEGCPNCGSKRLRVDSWLCELCLETARSETIKLVEEFLLGDLGLSLSEMSFNFSGHRGYHVHVYDESVLKLTQEGRREITDYIRAQGLSPRFHGFSRVFVGESFPDMADPGWRGRLARGLYDFISTASFDDLKRVLGKSRVAKLIYDNREFVLGNLGSSPSRWPSIRGVSFSAWSRIASYVAGLQRSHIDERVTTDIKRLMRLPGSIHGKTGFRAQLLTFSQLESFDPLNDAISFRRGEIRVHVSSAPRVVIGGEEHGPFEDVVVELPMSAAVYLLCKGAASLVE